jgi:hypothetical protein
MKCYEFPISRTAAGVAAIAMTAVTFGLAVAVPLHLSSASPVAATRVAQGAGAPPATEVTVITTRIDAVADREPLRVVGADRRHAAGKRQAI